MRSTLVLLLATGACAYIPRVAEWSTAMNPHRLRAISKGAILGRDISELEIASSDQLSYSIDVTLGNQNVKLLLDSGSFSLWTAAPDYVCTNLITNFTQDHCGIVGVYDPANDPDASLFPEAYDDASYGSGFAEGDIWNTTISIAGLSVSDFPIGYANKLENDVGNGDISGIIGLGIGNGTGFWYDDIATNGALLPIGLFNRLKDQLAAWQFAITFGKGISNGPTDQSNNGTISFGGISPSMGSFDLDSVATMPISAVNKKNSYTFWGGQLDGIYIGEKTNETVLFPDDVLVDSGTAYMIVDNNIYNEYNQLWTPNATFVNFTGAEAPGYWYVECNATAPDLTFVIGGKDIIVPSSDLIYRTENGTCRSAIVPGTNVPKSILGMNIFKSNIVVFDGDEQAIHFAPKI